jgi:hypothetical protein
VGGRVLGFWVCGCGGGSALDRCDDMDSEHSPCVCVSRLHRDQVQTGTFVQIAPYRPVVRVVSVGEHRADSTWACLA